MESCFSVTVAFFTYCLIKSLIYLIETFWIKDQAGNQHSKAWFLMAEKLSVIKQHKSNNKKPKKYIERTQSLKLKGAYDFYFFYIAFRKKTAYD